VGGKGFSHHLQADNASAVSYYWSHKLTSN